jgi:cytochrome c551/c552
MVVSRVTVTALSLALFLAPFFALGACSVGEVPIGGDGGTGKLASKAVFDATIQPLLNQKGCVTCHAAAQPPNFSSYDALAAMYKTGPSTGNKLLTEAADGALHNGVPYFTTAEKTTVANWLDGK